MKAMRRCRGRTGWGTACRRERRARGRAGRWDAIGTLPDMEIDIAGAAIQLARVDEPGADWAGAEAQFSALARDAAGLAADTDADVSARAGALAGLISGRHGFLGDADTYDDPANANIIRVMERRRGLPVALGVVWLHCARAAGWDAHGLDFPGHFLLALGGAEPRNKQRQPAPQHAVLDVFSGGTPLHARDLRELVKRVEGPDAELRPGLLAPMSTRGGVDAAAEQRERAPAAIGRPGGGAGVRRGHAADCAGTRPGCGGKRR